MPAIKYICLKIQEKRKEDTFLLTLFKVHLEVWINIGICRAQAEDQHEHYKTERHKKETRLHQTDVREDDEKKARKKTKKREKNKRKNEKEGAIFYIRTVKRNRNEIDTQKKTDSEHPTKTKKMKEKKKMKENDGK